MEHGFQYQRDLQIVSIHNRPSLDSTIRNSHQQCLGTTPDTILRTSALATLNKLEKEQGIEELMVHFVSRI